MMTFISCAKTMTARSKTPYPETSTPHFLKEARENALYMTQFTAEELAQMLKVNPKFPALPRVSFTGDSCPAGSFSLHRHRVQAHSSG